MILDYLEKYSSCPVCQKNIRSFFLLEPSLIMTSKHRSRQDVIIQNFNIFNQQININVKTNKIKIKNNKINKLCNARLELVCECRAGHYDYTLNLDLDELNQKIININLAHSSIKFRKQNYLVSIQTNFLEPQTKILTYGSENKNQEFILSSAVNLLTSTHKQLISFIDNLVLLS